jgi:hypothetical protein
MICRYSDYVDARSFRELENYFTLQAPELIFWGALEGLADAFLDEQLFASFGVSTTWIMKFKGSCPE